MDPQHSYRSTFPLTAGIRPDAADDATRQAIPETGAGVSVIVPFYNETECVRFVLEEIRSVLPEAEIIAIDDGSSDDTWTQIQGLEGISGLHFTKNRGQSAAVYAGLRAASNPVCVLLDGDGQNDPADIPKLVALLTEADVVCGRRAKRQDTWSRRAASRIANKIRRSMLNDGVSDTGCSLKAFSKDCVELLVPFNGLHRFLPAIFTQAGLIIKEVDVNHRSRKAGISKYTNWERALRGLYDLFGVSWLLKRKVLFPPIEKK